MLIRRPRPAQADRATAMSWAFEGDCNGTSEYEQNVMKYWATREKEETGNAFYQQGESVNEAARVCIDRGIWIRRRDCTARDKTWV